MPILLDIGAVWCHWCHVMDGESYEDPGVAETLNRDFVCIKVDRDERPDVDTRYQRAVQALTGQGGWPLTAFLTPEGEVFFGGTYFPPEENHYGRPGFLSVLKQMAGIYQQQRDKVAENATAIRRHVAESLDEAKSGEVAPATLERAASEMARLFDIRYGGFGTAPKFPHPAAVQLLLARWHDTRENWMREVVEKTLTGMANGGIRDHVGGGFHRYAVDERWIVPHFEKMAYDNSELLHVYLDGYAALGHPLFKEVAQGIVSWVLEVLSARDKRTAPYVDTTPYVNWNAMMASAFLHAGAVLDRPECNALALKVLERIWAEAWDEGHGMGHVIGRAEPRGLLEDNADAAAAFLDAWEATGEEAWLTRAIAVMRYCGRAHRDDAQGGFFDVARDRSGAAYLATPAKPVQDSPTPSANGVAALVLARLWAVTDDNEWRRLLDRQLATFGGAALQLALYGATLVRAIDWALNPVTRVEVSGARGPGPACEMHLRALQAYRPRKVVVRKTAQRPAATVCVGTTCSLPVTTLEALGDLLR